MTLQEMRKRKGELGYSYEMLAEMAELPLSTVQKVLGGVTKHPRRKTIEALERVLTGNQEEYLRKYNWDDLREKDPEAYERKVQKLIANSKGSRMMNARFRCRGIRGRRQRLPGLLQAAIW